MSKRRQLYDGKAKTIFEGPEPGTVIQYFKDDTSAFDGVKKAVISGKGVLNNRISAHIMTKLEGIGIPTHFIRSLNMREQLVRQLEIIPVELVMRNIAAGSLCKRYGIPEGTVLQQPLVEFFYKSDELHDPLVSEQHIMNFGWAWPDELEEMVHMAWRVNDYLNGLFAGMGLKLVDFKLEFGRLWGENGELYILLADEISPDSCRLWDAATGEKLDKDRFRYDLGDLTEGYQKIARKLGLIPEGGLVKDGTFDEELAESLGDIENELARKSHWKGLKVVSKKPRKV
ncbi:MAG: phosphoribosylaminoimidazolesuccinocarboxamide synthase [Alphaproteobacteria bacterium]|nr:phosphoribosylaminoimidazolesuccinocarboxamide synthase [Alphaproteobacteria bacterium]